VVLAYDNYRLVINALTWLKNVSYEVYQVPVDGNLFDVEARLHSFNNSSRHYVGQSK